MTIGSAPAQCAYGSAESEVSDAEKGKPHPAEPKARVALKALQGAKTVNEIASEHDLNPNLVRNWRGDPEVKERVGRGSEAGPEGKGDPGPHADQITNAVKSLVNTAPKPTRSKYSRLSGKKLMSALKRKRPATGDAVADVLMLSLSTLAAAWLEAETQAEELESHIERIVREKAPAMLEIDGCGYLSAVELDLAAGDNPERMRSEASFAMLCGASPIEASSGKTVRHRLNRGGNRQANRALHSIVISRMCSDERTSEYIARRVSEGKSKREAMRCLKRYVAREVYRGLMSPTATRHAAGAELAARRKRAGLLQRDIADRLGTRTEVVSSIETERAKYLKTRGDYEALLDDLEKGVVQD